MRDLEGRTAFVTGGAGGIGLGMVRALAEKGVSVAIADITPKYIAETREQLAGQGNFHFLHLDVTDRDGFARAADEAESALGPVSILCNNAGVGVLGDIQSTAYADWDWTVSVNIGGVVNGMQTFLPRLLARGEGHIVNTSSIGGILPGPGGAAYLASKAAILGLSEAACCDLRGTGVGVTVVLPGPTSSNIHKVAELRPAAYAETGLAEVEQRLAANPIALGGMDPLESGRMVVEAIERNHLYLFTHKAFRHALQQRFDAVMTAFGPDMGGAPATESYGFPTFNPLFADIIAASQKD